MTDQNLTGRVALVTGASRGIGLATARHLAAAGARVVLTSRSQESAEAAAATIGDRARGFGAHATDEDQAQRCVDFTISTFGSLDILVNNAGTNPAFGRLIDQDHRRFTKTVEVNLWAPILWTALAARAWMSEHGGAVVNTASIGATVHEPGLGVYNASKAALIYTTEQLALELAPNIRVNAVAPGVIRTELARALWEQREPALAAATALARIGEPDDVAAAIAYLVSDAACWTTGTTLVIDGGQRLGTATGFGDTGRPVAGRPA
ncbi:NAD(P)-dependent dehydrogenase (short-subunit alcohol dehydrogenase family) [Nocardia tenerifensis]|uniref:NAD(P)-dependent dehydrogenase (Short-subunit alcohol dehydrogenase family) n=1 Tax=Nocardia tenerifensis TaxID=228006 RepID=A0A318KFE6_9NOCA|nr:SDR family oxidoreductase [Nocardia tenerifensis]PXX70962.1 NAD(P)-dependent dehydrogenase (short-subunit alcohol dehydrogenase family) [Nocardia tenerifensis]